MSQLSGVTAQIRGTCDKTFNAIRYGSIGLSVSYGSVGTHEEILKVLDAVCKSGRTFSDIIDAYDDNEDLIAKQCARVDRKPLPHSWPSPSPPALRLHLSKKPGKRNEIFLPQSLVWPMENLYIRAASNKSPSRLGVDHVDLCYLHHADPVVLIERTVAEMTQLVKAEKVKYPGPSRISASALRRAHAPRPIAAIEVEHSPPTLDIEGGAIQLVKTTRKLSVKIIACSPRKGLTTDRQKSPENFEGGDFRKRVTTFSKENFHNILKLANGLEETRNMTLLLARSPWSAC